MQLIRLLEIAGEAYFAQDFLRGKLEDDPRSKIAGGGGPRTPFCEGDEADELCELALDELLWRE